MGVVRRSRWMLLYVAVSLLGCRTPESGRTPEAGPLETAKATSQPTAVATTPVPTPVPESSAATSLPPLSGLAWLVKLDTVSSPRVDVVTPPLGSVEKRPIVVAVHGAGDRPEWACGGWRIGVEAFSFVICPGGSPLSRDSFAWSSVKEIESAVDRAVAAVLERFPQYVREQPRVYAGFSQGATLASSYLIAHATTFPVAALAEGGYGFIQDPAFARQYHAAGGKRILLLCGSATCFAAARRARIVLERVGLAVLVSGDAAAGHNLNQRMQNALRRDWAWLVEGIPGWETYPRHRWPSPPNSGR